MSRDKVRVEDIEVVQAIQTIGNKVPLITGKRTFARVYLDPSNVPDGLEIAGSLYACTTDERWEIRLDSTNTLGLRGNAHPQVEDQRLVWADSLNFELPDDIHGSESQWTLKLDRVEVVDGGKRYAVASASRSVTVRFEQSPELRCRVIAYRYRDLESRTYLEPMEEDVDTIRGFMESAFPAQVVWSLVYVDATQEFRALNRKARRTDHAEEESGRRLAAVLRQTMAIRNEDLKAGRDPRTLYLGVFEDPTGRLGGAAVDSPAFLAPHIVAAATAESDGQLGAHEFAHVLGRRHPGVPPRDPQGPIVGQLPVDELFPGGEGFIGEGSDDGAVGLDTRVRGGPPLVLHHSRWFDLMGYRHPKWVSPYTYGKLLDRIRQLDAQGGAGGTGSTQSPRAWTIIGQYDLDRGVGRIHYVLETDYRVRIPPGELDAHHNYVRIAVDRRGPGEKVYVRRRGKSDLPAAFGLFQHTIEGARPPDRVYLRINRAVADVYANRNLRIALQLIEPEVCEVIKPSSVDPDDEDLRRRFDRARGRYVRRLGIMFAYYPAQDHYAFEFQWPRLRANPARGDRRRANLGVTTIVQCMRPASDEGLWETVTVTRRSKKRVTIDPVFVGRPRRTSRLLSTQATPSVAEIKLDRLVVRVIVTNGFDRKVVYDTFPEGRPSHVASYPKVNEDDFKYFFREMRAPAETP